MTDMPNRPLAILLAMAMFVLVVDSSIMNGLIGLLNSFRMSRLPDIKPSSAAGGMVMC